MSKCAEIPAERAQHAVISLAILFCGIVDRQRRKALLHFGTVILTEKKAFYGSQLDRSHTHTQNYLIKEQAKEERKTVEKKIVYYINDKLGRRLIFYF